jgi:oligopeptide transport system substrate-binding protein
MRYLGLIIVILTVLYSCVNSEKRQFKFAGGTFKMALDNEPATFNTMEISDLYSSIVVSQIMEGLVSVDPKSLQLIPQIAKSWKISDDGKTYEFIVRDDIFFHSHPLFRSQDDRRLKVNDVKYTFERICSKNSDGTIPYAYNFLFKDLLLGADDHLEGRSSSVSGIKVKGKKLILKLLRRDENFLSKLSNVCASICSEQILKSGNSRAIIGTGPFRFDSIFKGRQKSVILLKNEDYYLKDKEGNDLPYLDQLEFFFQNRKLDQLSMFESGQTDVILGLPTNSITKMLEGRIADFNSKPPKFLLYDNPLLSTQFYFFNMSDSRFKDPRVRQAFNYAVDREKIGRKVLSNQFYELGYYGIVPPLRHIFKGYDFEKIKEVCYSFNPDKAKKLLAEAGYPEGKGFGTVNLRFNIDETHAAVAEEFAQEIFQHLNINVNIDGSTFDQKEMDGTTGKGDLFRSSWYGDYASPETFLINFYGKMVPPDNHSHSFINPSRYANPLFDHFFELAKNSERKPEVMENFAKAERILMQDPPIIPLWYMGDIQIVYSNVRNLHFNARNLFLFREVYKKEWTEEEYTEATN